MNFTVVSLNFTVLFGCELDHCNLDSYFEYFSVHVQPSLPVVVLGLNFLLKLCYELWTKITEFIVKFSYQTTCLKQNYSMNTNWLTPKLGHVWLSQTTNQIYKILVEYNFCVWNMRYEHFYEPCSVQCEDVDFNEI